VTQGYLELGPAEAEELAPVFSVGQLVRVVLEDGLWRARVGSEGVVERFGWGRYCVRVFDLSESRVKWRWYRESQLEPIF
jgi:hypothetical protein